MKRIALLAVVFALGLTAAGCTGATDFSNKKIKYKMTVTVETPEGIRTGYAVREAGRYTEPSILPDQGGTMYNINKGEAVVVDLGERGFLFVLLGGVDEARTVFKALYQDKSNSAPASIKLSPTQYPKLVRFQDMTDPETIEMVVEMEPCADPKTGIPHSAVCVKKDRFEELYGEGVRLRAITIELSDEDVTRNAGQYIPSYKNQAEYMEWFRALPYGDPRAINANDFGTVGGVQ
jgi:hypothetical protein